MKNWKMCVKGQLQDPQNTGEINLRFFFYIRKPLLALYKSLRASKSNKYCLFINVHMAINKEGWRKVPIKFKEALIQVWSKRKFKIQFSMAILWTKNQIMGSVLSNSLSSWILWRCVSLSSQHLYAGTWLQTSCKWWMTIRKLTFQIFQSLLI